MMETQDFNKELMDYLYDEMSAEEKKTFEKKLAEDTELQKEYDELKDVRQELDKLQDKEVMEPFSMWGTPKPSGWFGTSKRRLIVFRPVTAVAASLIILMLVGYLTNFSISINDQGLFLGFGNNMPSDLENYVNKDEVTSLINQELSQNNEVLLSRLTSSQHDYDSKITALESSVAQALNNSHNASITDGDLKKFFAQVENRNTELMKEYLKVASTQQQEYFKTMLTQFNEYVQKQRSEDLTLIRNSLIDIKQSQTLQKQETDQAIASLFTSVSQRGN